MKRIILIFVLLFVSNAIAQSNFSKGFEVGYKQGWCYDKGVGCLPPIPPIAPIPKIGENINSYDDGYRRGFTMGQQDSASKNGNSSNGRTRQRYETADPVFAEGTIYMPNFQLMREAQLARQNQYQEEYEEYDRIMKERLRKLTHEKYKKIRPIIKLDISLLDQNNIRYIEVSLFKLNKLSFLLEKDLHHFLLETGVEYSKKTFHYLKMERRISHIDNEGTHYYLYPDSKSFNLTQIIVPFTVKYKLIKYIRPKIGAYATYNIYALDYDETHSSLRKEKYDFGLNTGIEFRIGSLIIDTTYTMGFLDFIKGEDLSYRNKDFLIGLGIAF